MLHDKSFTSSITMAHNHVFHFFCVDDIYSQHDNAIRKNL